MPQQILNAAPMTILQGIQDSSTTQPVIVPEQLPSHLPKIYLYTQQGPLDDQLVSGDSMTQMYGASSFDLRSPWATHATVLANAINAQGNQIIIRRLQPADAPKAAGMRLSLDVLGPMMVPLYNRNSDGTYALDPTTGAKVPTGSSIMGYQVKWVVGAIPNAEDGSDTFGLGEQGPGDQTEVGGTALQSVRYPIMDFEAPSFGAYGSNNAAIIYAPTTQSSTPIDTRILQQELVYPFRMSFATRPAVNQSSAIVPTTSGGQYVDFCFVPNTIDENTDAMLYADSIIPSSWQDIDDPDLTPNVYGPFGSFFSYDANIQTLVAQFYAAEKPVINSFSDFTGVGAEQNLFNFVSGVSSSNVPYESFVWNTTDANAVTLTENTNLYALGGGDGTMNETLFDGLVATAIQEYADPTNPIQDTAAHPESIFYDSGFTTPTKNQLVAFISNRKDTFLVWATHDVLGPALTAAQESSLALALKTTAQLYPESVVFGTPVTRAMIVGRSGTYIGSQYTKRLPITIEVAIKSAKYMGAGNGIWNSTYNFDQAPNSQIQYFSNINVTFTPATQRNSDWQNGLVWVQSFTRKGYFIPALKTVYDDDTSVLNSYFTALICCELEKIGERSWREYSGESKLTDQQLIAGVNGFISNAVLGRFDNRVVIQPVTTITGADAQRGYSWTTVIQVYANNMRTVATISIDTNRMSALAQTTTAVTA